MSLVPSLLQAIVNIDGDALVMHAGDKPYVVSPSGQVELASRGLTLDAVNGVVAQLLPIEFQNALDEFGAVQYVLPAQADFPEEQFTVVVARGGEDVWAEIRRRKIPDEDRVPEEFFDMPASPGSVAMASAAAPPFVDSEALAFDAAAASQEHRIEDSVATPEVVAPPVAVQPPIAATPPEPMAVTPLDPIVMAAPEPVVVAASPEPVAVTAPEPVRVAATSAVVAGTPEAVVVDRREPAVVDRREPVVVDRREPVAAAPPAPAPVALAPPKPVAVTPPTAVPVQPAAAPASQAAQASKPVPSSTPPRTPPVPGVVLPMTRSPIRADSPPPPAADTLSGLERLLRTAAARGASALYLSSEEQPSIRVDGELQILDGEPVHTASDVVSLLLTLMPDRSHEALRTGATTEWISDIEDIGRVRCMSFRDHRGPGGVFRLMPVRTVSVEQLGLAREIQSLAMEPEGLVVIAGSRSSGKRTLTSSLVDLINRTRRDHVITIEREVNIVHARGSSFISQREVRGDDDELLTAARAALREDPDVLVLEQVRTGLLMNVALEAAASGHLVIAGVSAHTATDAIDRIIDLYAPEFGRQVQLALADTLRGVVAQVLLPKIGGGRVPAREVLLNTPAVAGVIAEGKTSQLPMAIEGGRRHGMVPLHDALIGYVQTGVVDVRDAYRHVNDRPAFLALLKRHGVDTSAIERLA